MLYRAAVISAFSLFERELRRVIGSQAPARTPGLVALLEHAVDRNVLTPSERDEVKAAYATRNAAVHEARDVSARTAKTIVQLLMPLSSRLRNHVPGALVVR